MNKKTRTTGKSARSAMSPLNRGLANARAQLVTARADIDRALTSIAVMIELGATGEQPVKTRKPRTQATAAAAKSATQKPAVSAGKRGPHKVADAA